MGVRIVSDSTADVPKKIAESLGITIIPLNVHFGAETYLDGVDLDAEEFYRRLKLSVQLPTTSQPSVGAFLEKYQEILDSGDVIVSIHVSSKLSGTYESAVQAREETGQNDKIVLVDSEHVGPSLALIVIEAARAAQNGSSLEETTNIATDAAKNAEVFVLLETLENLQKGGRIGKAQALMGSILKIKPILSLKDGLVEPLDKARTRTKGMARLVQLGESCMPVTSAFVAHANAEIDAEKLKQQISDMCPDIDIPISEVGPVLGTHAGEGALCLAFIRS
ncbi:MAG: EDD domain protein [Chloroflexi bacterium]|nr:EDD domain protein [Chloroflexota bacterium]|tara:strand:- start:1834 stop:2670 length:837 start_codon:yes stop_codon:yes gene_type:complete